MHVVGGFLVGLWEVPEQCTGKLVQFKLVMHGFEYLINSEKKVKYV